MKDINVLVTGCGAPYSYGQLSCLRGIEERKINIIGCDMEYDPSVLSYVDKLYKVSRADSSTYIDELLEICKKESIDVLLPTMSIELIQLRDNLDRFKKTGVKVSVSDNTAIEVCINKLSLYDFMKAHGMKTPLYCSICSVDDLDSAFQYIGYPQKAVVVKALDQAGSRGIRIVSPDVSRFDILFHEKPNSFFTSFIDLKNTLSEKPEMPKMMVMEYLPGKEYSVDLLADHGKVLYIGGRVSNVNLASIPQVATLEENLEAYEIATEVISKLKLDGNADLDFKFDCNGHPVLMEINPRVAATMQIFKQGGVNLLYLRIKQLLGEELPDVKLRYGVKMKRRYIEMFC